MDLEHADEGRSGAVPAAALVVAARAAGEGVPHGADRYRGGVAAYLEVLDEQRSLFDAELGEAGARRDELVALVQVYKALGGGWPDRPESAPDAAAQGGPGAGQ